MKVLSIDVGIKNLAYCLLEVTNENIFKIIQWNVLNLCETEHKCNIQNDSKKNDVKNNSNTKMCYKKATHVLNNNYICSTHLKKLHPDIVSIKTIKKAKLSVLLEIANKYNISIDKSHTKKQITDILIKYIEENVYHEIISVSANNIDLISIGISIKNLFNEFLPVGDIDKIIIENQISPIANRMKSIQGMISQYFIMNNKTDIHFISSANKLKYFLEGKKTEYGERKKMSIDITKTILSQKEDYSSNFSLFIKHNKKDDLADSFLQGLWYLLHNSYITLDTKMISDTFL
jgi:hypothetical protein